MIEKCLTKEKSLVSAAVCPPQLHCLPFTISPWGRAGHIPKAASEGALSPGPPKGLCSAFSANWLPYSERTLLNSPRVQESRAWPCWVCPQTPGSLALIYLLMHSLPSVFILLSAQDKWFPHSAELQRLQSS